MQVAVQDVPSARVLPHPAELAGKVGIVHGFIAFVHCKVIFVGDNKPAELQVYLPSPVESYPGSHFCIQLAPSARVALQPLE